MAIAISDESEFAEGGKAFPPGFRFHPTDEELVLYYLKRKICHHRIILDVIAEIDVYKCDPQDLPGSSKLKTGDRQWFFFSPRDRKYPNGARSNRASKHGYWKVTGKDRIIKCNSRTVGVKKTLVFYRGRAPSKERTDWVMHEYTLDEDELKRCPDAKEYFALYKVYKKSGPGPKNGEQYGAPFKEEDWADDDCFGFEALFNSDSLTKQSNEKAETVPVENELDSSFIALEEFMNQIAEEDLPLVNYENALEHLLGDEVTQSTSVNYVIEPQFDQNNVDFTQLYEAPEVTSAAQNTQVQVEEENFLEDYLEMDDLIDPQPNSQNLSLSNFDLFHDADMFVNEGEHSEISQTYTNSFDLVIDESRENFYPVFNLENETMSHQQSQLTGPTFPSTSGVVNNSIYENIQTGSNQNQNGNGIEDSSWLSAALWSFVESIPTTPASAADNAIVNKAFERISSFSRVRINSITPNNASSNSNSNSSSVSCRKSKNGLVYFSIIGALCAILWVILGMAVKVLSRYVFS